MARGEESGALPAGRERADTADPLERSAAKWRSKVMLYFTYGSNMDWDEMHTCCPSALFSSTARLDDYKLAFTRLSSRRKCGVTDVLSALGCCVWGVVYDIGAPRDIDSLNRKEGYRPGRAKNAYAPLS